MAAELAFRSEAGMSLEAGADSEAIPAPAVAAANTTDAEYRRMLDSLPVLSWRGLPDGSRDFFNRGWYEFTGLSPAQARGMGWRVVVHPDDLADAAKNWRQVLSWEEPGGVEARLRRFDGSYRWFISRAVPMRDDRGNIVMW